MDIKFKEKLEQRKRELMGAKAPAGRVQEATPEERWGAQLDSFIHEATQKFTLILVGAAIFSIVLNVVLFKDWWNFIGSPEYGTYKQRIEREK